MKNKLFFSLLLAVIVVVTGYSQVTSSRIQGVVLDDASVGLFGANVVAKHIPTGTVAGTVTTDSGRFSILNLRVGGPYTITVSFVGFKTVEFTNVYLDLGKAYDVDIKLEADSQQLSEVVISGSKSATFNNERTGAETSVGSRELTKLPTISRSASDFTRLDPSSSNGSFGGRNDQFNSFTLDGSIFNNPFGLDAATPGGQTDAQPVSLDAIEQISVSSAPYDVTLSGFTGASINAVTKSGTNKVAGTVYGYFRNQDLTGSKINGQNIFVPKLEQTQYGFSVGAPIVKDKLFIFANFEKDERTDLGQTWLPNTGSGAINESRVTRSDLLAVQSGLRSIGYEPGEFEGFTHDSKSKKGIVKLDWNVNENNRLAFTYNFLEASKEKPAHPTAIGFRGPSSQTLQFENSGYEINNKLKSGLLELNSKFADNVSNKFQIGYTHFDDFRNPFSSPAPSINIYKNGSPYIIVGHEPFSVHNKLDQKVFQFNNNLNITQGNHNYTIGFSFEKFQFDNSFNLTSYGFDLFGSIDFNSFNANNYVGAISNAQASFDANNEVPDGTPGAWALAETNVGQMAIYAQDEWNISDNFKLTYGFRFDKPLFFDSSKKAQEVIDRAFVLSDIPYVNPNNGETVLIDNTQMPSNNWIISPRVGFNYDVNGDKTLQLRGGSGIFTGRFPFVWLGNQIAAPDVFFLQAVDPDYKFPTVWRTNIGVDKQFENDLILTTDVSYTKDINGPQVQNWALLPPSGTLKGVDNRPIYTSADYGGAIGGFGLGAGPYVFTNSDKGRVWNATLKAQKTFDNNLYTMLAYNYLNAKDVNSVEDEITSGAFANNAIVGDANAGKLGYSKYGDTHRIIGVASKTWKYGSDDKWETSLSTFFEYAQGGRFNYIYGGDINGDGSGINDLIYVPTATEIGSMQFSGNAGQQATQKTALERFIAQDDYLSEIRGSYAERYGAVSPWRGKWDVKFIQELKVSKDNAIQFSADILNLGNLLYSHWGLVEQPQAIQPIGVTVDGAGNPTYSFDQNLIQSYVIDSSLLSRWQVQFGLRYIF
ncbi:carboxypeptidase regulatory-like domain-containing protein [Lutibacter sp.]|uniref:TonB-dependent receptor n=1 Tax=Lutibacter sp. TaxID=1925666 RepID=UPI002736BFC6|nr:carboxypeptidase regulatory-like domain-containing protein [Lutibacter sp.]MDP3312626.1 carboxypeptidase regulatory-like domain-containing protein [Lutibacter sp.]